ncbi:MAG TPA: helix-turn-helix domain-containing protein [Candidatus Limosilactobacillus intestinavium]|nr:helix-turn-helix domain-containing protein [Candidatus Limosilactobacillus intestinavium]
MTKFSLEVKLKAVQMYLAGIGSRTATRRLGIKGHMSVQTWVARYQKYGVQGLEIRSSKYDYDGDFKLKVLNWKKQNKASYSQTALQFDISNFGTIANWQRKVKEGGIEALFTRRGRAKHMTTNHNRQARKQLSELERLKAENRTLKVENEYLKKLEALVQLRGQSKKNIKSFKN